MSWPATWLLLALVVVAGIVFAILAPPSRQCHIMSFGDVLQNEPRLYAEGRDPTIDPVNGSWRTATDFKLCYLRNPK